MTMQVAFTSILNALNPVLLKKKFIFHEVKKNGFISILLLPFFLMTNKKYLTRFQEGSLIRILVLRIT